MRITCDRITYEKNRLHAMGHVSHENGIFSHVVCMRKKGLRMRKVCMRTPCEILNRTDDACTRAEHSNSIKHGWGGKRNHRFVHGVSHVHQKISNRKLH